VESFKLKSFLQPSFMIQSNVLYRRKNVRIGLQAENTSRSQLAYCYFPLSWLVITTALLRYTYNTVQNGREKERGGRERGSKKMKTLLKYSDNRFIGAV